jgi:hypothetical protein
MGLIDLKTNLRSFYNGGGYTLLDGSNYKPSQEVTVPEGFKGLKYGRDLPGGGSSDLPDVVSPISNGISTNTPDFFLRQGALQSALVDVTRLTNWFSGIKGILFTTKQIALERMNPDIPGGLARIYNPLNTIAQVGVLPLNIHLNKQGVNGANFGYAEGGRDGYYYFTKDKAEQDDVGRLSLLFDTKIASSKQLTTRTADQRLFNISRDPEYSTSQDGGPGSIGGIGRTRIGLAGDGSNSPRDRTTTFKLSKDLIENPNEVYAFNNELLAKQESRGLTKSTSLTNLVDYRATINEKVEEALPQTPYSKFNREDNYGTAKTVYRVGIRADGTDEKELLKNPNASLNSDAINKLDVLFSKDKTTEIANNQNKDLVSFYFEVLNPKTDSKDSPGSDFLFFRAYVTDLGDSYKADWQNYKYIGRAENFYKYGGFGRDVSLSFTIYAHSREEMKPLYAKLNRLVGVTAPSYSNQGFMMGNILKITVGNYFNQMPGILTSISLKPSFEAGWDINRTADGTIIKFDEEEYVGQLPRLIDVSMNFTPIHYSAPQYKNSFINDPTPAQFQAAVDTLAALPFFPGT